MPPLLSVITVVKDDPEGFALTRASLAAQSVRDFEWLVSDGGSTEPTRQAIAAAVAAGEVVWWRSGPDGGPFGGMNAALPHATGDHLLFLNAGDRLAGPHTLASVARVLERHHPDLVLGDACEETADGRLMFKPARPAAAIPLGMPTYHCALTFRRSLISDMRYPTKYVVAADYAYTFAAIRRSAKIVRPGFPVGIFASGGLSQREDRLGRHEQDEIRRDLMGFSSLIRFGIRLLQGWAARLRARHPDGYAHLRFRRTSKNVVFPG